MQPQRLARREQVRLADKLVEGARTHALGQRTGAVGRLVGAGDGLKESHGSNALLAFGLWFLAKSQELRAKAKSVFPLSCRFIQYDAGGDSGVERFYLLMVRYGDGFVGCAH